MHVLDAPATCIVSVKLPSVLLRFIQRNSKALNYSDLSRPTIILDLSLQRQDQVSVYVYILCHRACIYPRSSCVNVCFHAGLPRSLYIQCDCMFPCWTPTEIISSCVNAGLPQSLYILLWCECVFPCWTPTELVYPV